MLARKIEWIKLHLSGLFRQSRMLSKLREDQCREGQAVDP
jgi:hypothetical protein